MAQTLLIVFILFGREGTINADAYRTVFENQVVVDIENPGALCFL